MTASEGSSTRSPAATLRIAATRSSGGAVFSRNPSTCAPSAWRRWPGLPCPVSMSVRRQAGSFTRSSAAAARPSSAPGMSMSSTATSGRWTSAEETAAFACVHRGHDLQVRFEAEQRDQGALMTCWSSARSTRITAICLSVSRSGRGHGVHMITSPAPRRVWSSRVEPMTDMVRLNAVSKVYGKGQSAVAALREVSVGFPAGASPR